MRGLGSGPSRGPSLDLPFRTAPSIYVLHRLALVALLLALPPLGTSALQSPSLLAAPRSCSASRGRQQPTDPAVLLVPLTPRVRQRSQQSWSRRVARYGSTSSDALTSDDAAPAGPGEKKAASSPPKPPAPAEFEYQEMKIQLNALERAGLTSPKSVNPLNRNEVAAYAKQVVIKGRPSLVAPHQLASFLPSTHWRLAVSTDDTLLQGLPANANVYLRFHDDSHSMEYVLEFGPQVLGLDRLVAQSRYSVDPNEGMVTYAYEAVTCDVGPFKNLGVGLFGMLQGRSSAVRATYLDGTYWIERGYGPTGTEHYNVYVRGDVT